MSNSDSHYLISILIPVYNVEEYVEECLESILSQIDKNAEIILMNDSSTDSSLQVISQYETHEQVTILSAPKNRGLSATRNALMPYSKGEYIWFIDSDDVMTAGAYKNVISCLKNKQVDVLCGDYVSWKLKKKSYKKAFVGKDNNIFYNTQNSFLKNVIENNSNHVWNKIFRKQLIEKISFHEGLKFEDIYYMTDLAGMDFSYSYTKCALIDYRERVGSIVKSIDEKYIDDYLGAFIHRIDVWKQRNDKLDGYLAYKSFNRYVSLIKELDKLSENMLLKYTVEGYHDIFMSFNLYARNNVDFFRRKKLAIKLAQLEKIY